MLLVGELFGLHTMRQILDAHGLKSNNWAKTLAKISNADIEQSVGQMLVGLLKKRLLEVASKSASTWSRAEVTIVFDDSIFKQWLKNEPIGGRFAKYFSGQTKSTVYGLRITLCGLCIGDDFFPAFFHLSHKGEDTKAAGYKLMGKLHGLLHQWGQEHGLKYPNLFASMDGGFDSEGLLTKCEDLSRLMPFTPICVPKKNCLFRTGNFSGSLQKLIGQVYLPDEQKHLEE